MPKVTLRKKVDTRVRTLIENGVKMGHRTMFVVVGDRAKEQVANLHFILSKATVTNRPSVLWCYNKDLGFTTHRKKRALKIRREIARGIREVDEQSPFELFVSCTEVRYTYYKETHKILGSTYGMCVLQDFEYLTPNLLARTVETVEGGGIILLMLKGMKSLTQLYTMAMNVHKRYRTAAHQDVVARFNERFLLSLSTCNSCLVVDDELNILPISSHIRNIKKLPNEIEESENAQELKEVQAEMIETQPAGTLVELCRTLDQAKAVLTFIEAISEKTLSTTVSMTAARGRGKSAALGFVIAGAIAYGYSNIFVTSPSPENLKTVFQMTFKALDALEYKEHGDYEIVQSTNPDLNHAVVRVNIFRAHRQTVQYIRPQDHHLLSQSELLVIDEAAAIPLPLVKKLVGKYYLVFMSSTINGYEGTGRSLSLKLIKQLREQSNSTGESGSGRTLKEVSLEEPIRYKQGDPIEKWLNGLLCLDCDKAPPLTGGLPHPSQCKLYCVNRDTLFSYHKAAERFLQQMMSLYVSSHYKNTPNDLQLISDAPAHRLFVLLGPVKSSGKSLPDILCVLQVCLEGQINRQHVAASISRGKRESGDLIPWCISQQFQDARFPELSGARIVRIAVHPKLSRMGYASRALELLTAYYSGDIISLDDDVKKYDNHGSKGSDEKKSSESGGGLTSELLRPRTGLKPMLMKLNERPPEPLHYLGVSYGLTLSLLAFWRKNGFTPVYIRQTANELTGEHTCIMIRPLERSSAEIMPSEGWLDNFSRDFQKRFVSLLSYSFSSFSAQTALTIFHAHETNAHQGTDAGNMAGFGEAITGAVLDMYFSKHDLKRLESYSRNLVDYHLVLDLVPLCASLYFQHRLEGVSLSHAQAAILMGIGLQRKGVKEMQEQLSLESNQILALFNKSMRKISKHLRGLEEIMAAKEMKSSMSAGIQGSEDAKKSMQPVRVELSKELKNGAQKALSDLRSKQMSMLESIDLKQYAIKGTEKDWEEATKKSDGVPAKVSVKSDAPAREKKPGGKKKKMKRTPKSSGGRAKKMAKHR
uniref:RNA cytidine acetyltransferase n=1 Tax=Amorphochlora amoebiformis TaxID=1561963 RepID=A0A6T6YLF8_9EUKA|mmetsp:Transcript_6963/g.10789  ORF Transcript_6963/g.10789 Transcript_6963/m.10789 type:complete len:1043 (+) Transcript_6963:79-3207(+)